MKPENRRVAKEGTAEESAPVAARKTSERPIWGWIRTAAGVALVLGIAVGMAWSGKRYVTTTSRFGISEVVVTGAKMRSAEELITTSTITKGSNIFSLDPDQTRSRLMNDPWVEDAVVTRRLPGSVYIQVKEREAAAIVATGETYLSTREGDLFKRLEARDPTDLPIITGLEVKKIAEDREGTKRAVRRAIDLAVEYDRTQLAQRSPLQEVHLETDGSMAVVVGKAAITVKLGQPPYRKKLDEAVRVFAELDRRGAKPETIMLDNEGRPERVVVRMK